MSEELKTLTASVVSAYLTKNQVAAADLPTLIHTTFNALVNTTKPAEAPVEERPAPAVSIRKSVTPDHIICLECGAKGAMLKRHIRTVHQLDPDQYRARWELPRDYPMVAPNYAAQRSELAKKVGLGTMRKRNGKANGNGNGNGKSKGAAK